MISSKQQLNIFELNYLYYVNRNLEQISSIINKFSVDNSVVECAYSSKKELQNKHLESVKKIYSYIGEYINNYDFIDSIHLYFPNSDYVLSTINAADIDDFYKNDIIYEMEREKDFFRFFKTERDCDFCLAVYHNKKLNYILMITTNSKVFLSNSMITPMIKNIQLNYDGDTFNIYKSVDDKSKSPFSTGIKNNELDFYEFEINIGYDYTENLHIGSILIVLFAVLFLSLALAIILSAIMSYYYQKEVSMIITKYEPFFITDNQKNELDTISFNIANLLQTNEQISGELSQKLQMIQELQIKLLQSQINPHFIFNTLNSLCMYITVNCSNYEFPVKMISLLSSIAREALDIDKYFCTISEEIEYTKKYIEIEQIKYNYKFDVVWNVDETILNEKIIKFILQPIVENAICYGFRPIFPEYAGTINITIEKKDNLVQFIIKNTGVPIDHKKVRELNKSFETIISPSSHIGLINTVLRIKTNYGNEYVGNIGIDEDGCTRVILRFPLK